MSAQAAEATRSADLVLFVVDVTTGITEEDAHVARLLQQSDTPTIVVANKVDDERREADLWDFARLGLGEPMPVSAIHGRLSGELLDAVVDALPETPEDEPKPRRRRDLQRRDRRPAERWQVDAVQPARR